jgi:hypothetical protein
MGRGADQSRDTGCGGQDPHRTELVRNSAKPEFCVYEKLE